MEQQAPMQSAKPQPVDRLRDYLRELPPASQALLMREFEKALERGEDTAVASFVLGELRKIVRPAEASERPRVEMSSRRIFSCLEPFLVDGSDLRPGQIRRASLDAAWAWLRQALPEQVQSLEQALAVADTPAVAARAVRDFQIAAAETIVAATAPTAHPRDFPRISSVAFAEDMAEIAIVLTHHEAFEIVQNRLPKIMRNFGQSTVESVRGLLDELPVLQQPEVLPYAVSLIVQRLASPWQITRLATSIAGSDDEGRIAPLPIAVAVSIVLYDMARLATALRDDIRRGQFEQGMHEIKALHDGLRDLRTELDIRSDSQWGRQLSAIRVEISNALKSEIESVPGRVRRLLRQRPDKDIAAGAKLDAIEIDETVALIGFVMVCRNYASELAINEVTLRAFSDLQHYVEAATETLVESLRGGDPRVRAFRQLQTNAAIRFCELIFGHDYATLMAKAAEVALSGDRKQPRAG
jgi:hypothetical protein